MSAIVARHAPLLAGTRWNTVVRLFLMLQAIGFVFMIAGTHGAFGPQPVPPTTTDFASFYAAGVLANRGEAASAYDPIRHRAVEAETIAPGVAEKAFLYPPVFLLVCAPLARLPYIAAFLVFEACTFAAWLALVTRIAGGGASAAMALAAIPSTWWALGWGQNSFLTGSLMAAGTLLVRHRPLVAGTAFGALIYKPHLAFLVPVALIAGGHWRALFGSGAMAAGLSALSIICFGLPAWRQFFDVCLHANAPGELGDALAGHVDFLSAAVMLGQSFESGMTIQFVATTLSVVVVAILWRRARWAATSDIAPHSLANAGLIAGTLAGAPFVLFYDLVVAGASAAWVARCVGAGGLRKSEVALFAALTCLNLSAFPANVIFHVPSGTLVSPILLWLIVSLAGTRHYGQVSA